MIILKENSVDHGNQVNKGTGMTFWSPFGFGFSSQSVIITDPH